MRKAFLLPILISVIALCSCNLGIMNQGYVEKPESSRPEVEEEFDTSAPRNVMATRAFHDGMIVVTWDSVSGADYYTLERAEFDTVPKGEVLRAASWTQLQSSVTDSKFTDRSSSLKAGKYYAYRVQAHAYGRTEAGEVSDACYGSILSSPTTLDATKGEDTQTISVTWSQMPGVRRYNIYVSSQPETVSIGTKVGTVGQLSSGEPNGQENSFSYTVPEDDKGETLYFAVASEGGNGTEASALSPVTSGYTRVEGSASTPEAEDVTQGTSVDSVRVRWAKDPSDTYDNPISYTVSRSYPGVSETVIYPIYSGQELTGDDETWYIEDTDVSPNVEYTYSIVARNSLGQSQALVVKGHLLSEPQEVTLTPFDENGEKGYAMGVTLPVGGESEAAADWTYEVTATLENGCVLTYGPMDAGSLMEWRTLVTADSPGDSAYQEEVRKVSVRTVNGDLVSEGAAEAGIQGIPDAPTVSASENKSSMSSSNSYGVYPVEITVGPADSGYTPASYVVSRDGVSDMTTTGEAVYDNEGMRPGKVYSWTATALDALGRSSGEASESDEGWGAIDGETFVEIFQAHILKPWEHPSLHPDYVSGNKSGIYGKVSQAGLGSLGSASATGTALQDGRQGSINYNATQSGLGGLVTFTYTAGYSEATSPSIPDEEDRFERDFYAAESGSYQMSVSMSGDGSVSGGPIVTGGMYPASVDFSGLSVASQKFVGKYKITQYHDDKNVLYEVQL